MKRNQLIISVMLVAVLGIGLVWNTINATSTELVEDREIYAITTCPPIVDGRVYADITGKFIRILPGWGNHTYKISTENDSAQMYFNQGLTMYYGYHMREAMASFKEAAKFDSTCAMVYWGQALADGPTYNFGYNYKMSSAIPATILLMNQYSEQATAKERDLITAMNRRYNPIDPLDLQRKKLNNDYAEALKPLLSKYGDDLDIKALFIDAVMLVHPWSFWNNNGSAKPWTLELVKVCREVLNQDPHHPAALHYYIHIVEASRKPEVALASADTLIKIYPGVAHLVHMSSHVYERIGFYAKGYYANEQALRGVGQFAPLTNRLNLAAPGSHFYAVSAYCALSGGMYKKAIQKTMILRSSLNLSYKNTYNQYLYMYPILAMVRMGKWQEILQDTTLISEEWTYAGILNDFAKGMAYAKTGDYLQAEKHLKQLRSKQKDPILRVRFAPPMSSPIECSWVAENILLSNIAFHKQKYDAALRAIRSAVRSEDSLIYSEPNLWMLPARHYMGAFLLMLNKPKEAEEVYREDLTWNPGNGWSLLGLYQALKAQRKPEELKELKSRYMNSFSHADILPTSSAY